MALYRKTTLTEASRYAPGMEDGWSLLWPSGSIFDMLPTREAAQASFDRMFRNDDEPHTGEIEPSIVPVIHTKEGFHAITEGDWIATGQQGERYPIKADIFAATYELADEAPGFDRAQAAAAASKIYDYADLNVTMFDACCDETPKGATDIYNAAKVLHELLPVRS